MDAIIRLANNFMDHRDFDDEIPKNHHYSNEFICFEQAFYLLHDKVFNVMSSEDGCSPEYIKFMTLLLLLRSIYNGDVRFCYNDSVYNGVPFIVPDRISGDMIDFKDAYRDFTFYLSSVTSLEFNSIPSIQRYSHRIGIGSTHKEKLKYGYIDFFRDENSDKLQYFQYGDVAPFSVGDSFSDDAKQEKEMISIPSECTRIQQDQEIIFEYNLDQNRLFAMAEFLDKILLPCDQRFLAYQESLISDCDDTDIDIDIGEHFYAFLLCNGISVTSSLNEPFQNYSIHSDKIENRIELSIVNAIDFFFHNTAYRVSSYGEALVKITKSRIYNFFQNPCKELVENFNPHKQLQVKSKHTQSAEQKEFSVTERKKKAIRNYEDYYLWARCRDFFGETEEVLKEAALELLNQNNHSRKDTEILKTLWKKRGYPEEAPIRNGNLVLDKKKPSDKEESSDSLRKWAQNIKRAIHHLAIKYKLPPVQSKTDTKANSRKDNYS